MRRSRGDPAMHALPNQCPVRRGSAGVPRAAKLAWTVLGAALGASLAGWTGMVRRVATRAPVRVAPAQSLDRSHRGQRSGRAGDLARRPARRVPSTPRRRHAAALGAGSGQRRIAVAAGDRGRHHALLVAGLARPRLLRRRGVEARVGRRGTGSARDRQRRPLDWIRRLVGGRRDDCGQQASRAVPRARRTAVR